MRGTLVGAGAVALAAACGDAGPMVTQDLVVRIEVDAAEVELGKAFPLTVVRTWSTGLVPQIWDDALLAPLGVRQVGTSRQESRSYVEETRTFSAWAFTTGELVVPAPTFVAAPKNGGVARTTKGNELRLAVRSSLDATDPGVVELPGGPLPAPRRSLLPWLAAIATAVALASWVWWRRLRSAAAPAEPDVPKVDPRARALARIAALRAADTPAGDAAVQAFYVEAGALLRDYLEERFGIRAPEMTTEQLLAAPATHDTLEPPQRHALNRFLAECDLVKFARHSPTAADQEQALTAAIELIR